MMTKTFTHSHLIKSTSKNIVSERSKACTCNNMHCGEDVTCFHKAMSQEFFLVDPSNIDFF